MGAVPGKKVWSRLVVEDEFGVQAGEVSLKGVVETVVDESTSSDIVDDGIRVSLFKRNIQFMRGGQVLEVFLHMLREKDLWDREG